MSKPNKNVRVVIHVDENMAERIRAKSEATGSTVGEVLRQAFRLSEQGDSSHADPK